MSGVLNGLIGSLKSSIALPAINILSTSGMGFLYSDATYYYMAYLSPSTFTNDFVVSGGTITADVLSVAGGGSGGGSTTTTGSGGGGGGAGGVVWLTSQSIIVGSSSIVVGSGGGSGGTQGNGGNSQFGSLTAAVGGGAGGYTAAGSSGGSGGGGGSTTTTAGSGTATQGNAGGLGRSSATTGGGGGGGFGGAGTAATSGVGGNGGAGSTSSSPFYSTVLAIGINSGLIAGGGAGGSTVAGTASAGGGVALTNYPQSTPGTGAGGGGGLKVSSGTNGSWMLGGSGNIIIRITKSQISNSPIAFLRSFINASYPKAGYGLSVDSSGNIYNNIYDGIKGIINKVSPTGNTMAYSFSNSNLYYFTPIVDNVNSFVYQITEDQNNFSMIIDKYDNSLSLLSSIQITDPSNTLYSTYPSDGCIDSSGNIYIVGQNTNSGSPTLGVLAKFNSSGTNQFLHLHSGTTTSLGCSISSVSTDSSGNSYVCGYYITSGTIKTGFIAKFNSAGIIQWQRSLTANTSYNTQCFSIVIDSTASDVYVTGKANTSSTNSTAFVAKYNASGTIQWQRFFVNSSNITTASVTSPTKIAIDSSSNIYILSSGTYPQQHADLLKYNSSGVLQWQRTFYDSYTTPNTTGYGLCLSGSYFYVSGNYFDPVAAQNPYLFSLPQDGTKTGVYQTVNYAVNTLTDSAGTLIDAAGTSTTSSNSMVLGSTLSSVTKTNAIDPYNTFKITTM